MYFVSVRDYMMIAHSLPSPVFGPAQKLHGATYVVDAEFQRNSLDENGIVVDIGLATNLLKEILSELTYRNLDELPQFSGKITTTEFLAQYIHAAISARIREQFQGTLKVTLNESHVALAGYIGPV